MIIVEYRQTCLAMSNEASSGAEFTTMMNTSHAFLMFINEKKLGVYVYFFYFIDDNILLGGLHSNKVSLRGVSRNTVRVRTMCASRPVHG